MKYLLVKEKYLLVRKKLKLILISNRKQLQRDWDVWEISFYQKTEMRSHTLWACLPSKRSNYNLRFCGYCTLPGKINMQRIIYSISTNWIEVVTLFPHKRMQFLLRKKSRLSELNRAWILDRAWSLIYPPDGTASRVKVLSREDARSSATYRPGGGELAGGVATPSVGFIRRATLPRVARRDACIILQSTPVIVRTHERVS